MQRILLYALACMCAFGVGLAADQPAPINLARTSLAEVDGSPVNGVRPIDSPFYGVLNLFDEGNHLYNGLQYTWWLGDTAKAPNFDWVETRFTTPVTVTGIDVLAPGKEVFAQAKPGEIQLAAEFDTKLQSGTQPLSLTVYDQNDLKIGEYKVSIPEIKRGGDGNLSPSMLSKGSITFPQPLPGVMCIRMVTTQSCARIDEWTIWGTVPDGVQYTVGSPKILWTTENSRLSAEEVYREWVALFYKDIKSTTRETDTSFITTVSHGNLDIFRITINKATGNRQVEMLVKMVPVEQPVGKEEPVKHP